MLLTSYIVGGRGINGFGHHGFNPAKNNDGLWSFGSIKIPNRDALEATDQGVAVLSESVLYR